MFSNNYNLYGVMRFQGFPVFGRRGLIQWIGLVIITWFSASPALATAAQDQQGSLPTEEDILGDIPVVLSATRLAQPRSEAPAAITVIDRTMIEASGIKDIPLLMRMVPGFQVGHDRESLFAPRQTPVTYHGYSDGLSRKMQVLIDGRSVYDPLYGGVRWSELGISIDDIDRIEVIRGPNAASYGANSFLGVINIITYHPTQVAGTSAGIELSDDGYSRGVARYSNEDGKYDYRLTAMYQKDQGLARLYDSKEIAALSYRGETKLNSQDTLEMQFGVNQGPRQMGDQDPSLLPNIPYHDAYTSNNYQHLRWVRRISAEQDYSLQFYHNYYQLDNSFVGWFAGAPTNLLHDTKTRRLNLEFQHTLRPGENFRLVWGAEARQDEAWGPGWFGTDQWQRRQMYRLFANGEWRPATDWVINAGMMAEQVNDIGAELSPRLAANYRVSDTASIRASISHAKRNPALFEQFANTIVNVGDVVAPPGTPVVYFYSGGNVQPENITSYELGYLYDSAGKDVSFDSKLFLMKFNNAITYAVDLLSPIGTYNFVNGGDAEIAGIEFQAKYRPSARSLLSASYSYAQHEGTYIAQINPTSITSSNASTPHHTFSLLLSHKLTDSWSGGLFYYFVSEAGWFSTSDAGYQGLNASLIRNFHLGSTPARFEIVGQNLIESFSDFDKIAGLDRRYVVGLKLLF